MGARHVGQATLLYLAFDVMCVVRHVLQKLCPQGVETGKSIISVQIEHSQSEIEIEGAAEEAIVCSL